MAPEAFQQSNVSFSQTLASLLLEKGFLSSDQLDIALKEQRLRKIPFEDCLLNLGFISEGALAEALSITSGYAKICLKSTLLDRYYGYDLSIQGLLKEVEASPSSKEIKDGLESSPSRLVNAILVDAIKL